MAADTPTTSRATETRVDMNRIFVVLSHNCLQLKLSTYMEHKNDNVQMLEAKVALDPWNPLYLSRVHSVR